ncbi:MAG TPA: amino acid adenylation domain-containing protein, partial [Candidatus Kapabacteria bacterium]|nr:amino acid adenylation domain-containing protein [Candidatus Kapabacteria bacterium]
GAGPRICPHCLTYRQLNEQSDRLAGALIEKGVLTDDIVAIMMERSVEMIISILGILKAGGAYLPIDPGYPKERIDYMLKDSKVKIIINSEFLINAPQAPLHHHSSFNNHHSNLAYIIYTSGSTGKPKGVMVHHYGLVNYIYWAAKQYVKNESINFPFYSSISFDLTVTSIFTPLITGNSVVIYAARDKELLIDKIIADNRIGIIKLTPAHLKLIREMKIPAETTTVKRLIVGGEKFDVSLAQDIYNLFDGRVEIYNEYGPTEAVVGCMIQQFDPGNETCESVPIGIPIDNMRISLLDKYLKPVPAGVLGEIYIGSDCLARGYLNQPELTAEKFDKYRSYRTNRTYINYKTGDLARWLPDGNIEFLGRIDHQVKIRGYRIELGEIETRLMKYPGIKQAVVLALEEKRDKSLCAYFVSDKEYEVSELREYLAKELPDYMIPPYFAALEKIPLTPNGKIDRKALPKFQLKVSETYTAPRHEVEKKLVKIYAEVLGRDELQASQLQTSLGIDDNFFHLGGHSLKATVLVSRVHKELNIQIPLVKFFKEPTIRALSEYIKGAREDIYRSIMVVEEKEYYLVSFAQKRMYILQQMELHSTAYNMPQIIKLAEDADIDRLKESFQKLLKRHDSLRTSFHIVENQPVQEIHKEVAFEIEYYDLATEVAEIIKKFVRPFDLAQAPLLRVGLIKSSGGSYILLLDMHHIISDGVSHQVLKEDFMSFYQGNELAPLRLQYKDFSEWQNSEHEKENLKRQEEFWLKKFPGEIPVLELPTDYPRPLIQSFTGDSIYFEIPVEETRGLNEVALQQGATLFMVLAAVFNILLAKLSGREEIIVGTPIAGRRHADIEKIIGMFVNTLSLINYPLGEQSFKEFLADVKERTLLVFENQEYPFEELVDKLMLQRDISRNPLFDVMFVLQNMNMSLTDHKQKIAAINEDENIIRTAKFDLTLIAREIDQRLCLIFEYCTQLFKRETIERFIIYFKKIITIITQSPGIRIKDIEIITGDEKAQILHDFNQTDAVYPKNKTIHQLFAEQASMTPDRIAVFAHGQTLSYNELNEQSAQLAGLLVARGVVPNTIVAINPGYSLEMIIGILGILKSGGAYLPIDPEYPQERIDYMLKDSNAAILSTNLEMKIMDNCRLSIVNNQLSMEKQLAYIIYTSGSTGKPKGVMVEHRSLVNLCCWHNSFYNVTSQDRATKYAGFGFDASVWEIFPYLVKGASLYIVPGEIKLDIQALNSYYQKNDITISFLPTQVCEQFLALNNTSLRILLTGGDKLRNYTRTNYRLYNNYGPTENTVVSTNFWVKEESANIPIGKPIANNQIYILDKTNYFQPVGILGELCIGGDSLARGYLNNPELTAERFYRSYWSYKTYIFYKTGDLARWLPDGNIEFLGRIDNQVKIRGYRIELEEIEKQLLKHNAIKEAVVIARTLTATLTATFASVSLCAYIIPHEWIKKDDLDSQVLKEFLSHQLPDYMIPTYFIKLEKIPLTIHGKVDRKALPDPKANSLKDEYMPPQNALEKKLATLWEAVLGRTHIGINENFFQAGGDSIKAIQIISRMNSAGYKLEMKDLFQYPVIADLAPRVKKLQRIPGQTVITGTIPLTPIQEMFFAQDYTDPHHYNQSIMFYAKERIAKEEINAVFKKIQEHHDALRMTYEINPVNGQIIQIAHGFDYPLSLEEFEINGTTADLVTIAENIQAGIDLEKGPLLKLGLFHLSDGDRLLIVIHHLVIDGVSWRILFADIETLHNQYKQGKKLTLPPRTDSFKTWAENLAVYANSKEFLKEKAYWQKIESLKAPLISKDFAAAGNYINDTTSISFTLSQEETGLLMTKVNMALGTAINDILLTALAMGIKKTFGHEQISIALEGHGREEIMAEIDVSRTVGWFTALYPVLADVSYAGDLNRQVKEIKEMLRHIPGKGIGYGILKYLTGKENKKEIEFKLAPQISFNYLGQFDADVKQLSFFAPAKESPGNSLGLNNKREYLLDVSGLTANNRLTMTISYNKTHFKPGTMADLNSNFQFELQRIIAFCAAKESREFTPSDFTYKGLSIESVNRLMELYPDVEDIYTLTPMQEGMLYHALVDASSSSYFEQISYRLQGELDIGLAEKSLHELFKRHDILRTAFVHENTDRPVQLVLSDRVCDFYYQDISQIKAGQEKRNFIKEFKEKDIARSF